MNSKKKVVTFGEIMLRMKSPGFERFLQSPEFEARFGGSEANVAISLSQFGFPTQYVTFLPENDLGEACLRHLHQYQVGTKYVQRSPGRMGLYFLERGSVPRSHQVIYDRDYTAIALADPDSVDWEEIFEDAVWFHFSGITPALSPATAEMTIRAARAACAFGVTVSCDLNYRPLWKWGKKAPEVFKEVIPHVDILMGNKSNYEDSLGISVPSDDPQRLAFTLLAQYKNIKQIYINRRFELSPNHYRSSAIVFTDGKFSGSAVYDITNVLGRVGSGDAFCAGLIYELMNGEAPDDAIEFATAASAFKLSLPGDVNQATVEEIQALVKRVRQQH